eukprot:6960468-Alexandrium_andersonii.AAC.1
MRLHLFNQRDKVPVAVSARDLGSQVNFGLLKLSGVSTARCTKVAAIVRHIATLPADCVSKAKWVR